MKTVLEIEVHCGIGEWEQPHRSLPVYMGFGRFRYSPVVVPEPYQAGDTTLIATGSIERGIPDLPSDRKIGEPGFRTRQRTFHKGVRTW